MKEGSTEAAPPTPQLPCELSDDDFPTGDEPKTVNSTKDKIPPVYNKRRGSKRLAFAVARDPRKRKEALEQYRRDQRSAGDTSGFNLKVWKEFHEEWYMYADGQAPAPFPLTANHIEAVGTMLKAADYRSSYNYLNAAKRNHIALGFKWDDQLELAGRAFSMSTQRGLGPGRQSEPLPYQRLVQHEFGDAPLNAGGPVGPKNALVLFTFYFVRGREGTMAKVRDIRLDHEAQTVCWRLSVSKTDPAALGCERKWGCLCIESPGVGCPFHAAVQQLALLCKLFPDRTDEGDIPLFPDEGATWCWTRRWRRSSTPWPSSSRAPCTYRQGRSDSANIPSGRPGR